jgi:hypothetical protein
VMEAALGAGVERVIYTSSVATIAVRSDGTAADETKPLREDQAIGAYKRSKVAAERLVEAMVAERGLPAVIVNPSTPIGPCDVKPTPTGRIIIEAAKGRIPGKMSCFRKCCAILPGWSAAVRRAYGCRGGLSSPSHLLPKPWRTSPGANRLRPGTGCTWRNIECSLSRPRPNGNSDIAQGFTWRELMMRFAGFAILDTWVPSAQCHQIATGRVDRILENW